ncbi:MAG: glycosyltransferase family 4 protein [Candidatus Promineifilaceae bacterium]
MKVAIVCQPSDQLLPPYQTPAAQWSYQVAGRLTLDADVTIFGRKSPTQTASIVIEDSPFAQGKLRFRFIHSLPAFVWTLLHTVWMLFSAETHPLAASRLYHLPYSLHIAREIRREAYDIVHIHNLAQFVSVIRFFNPQIQIVLHTHDATLTKHSRRRTQIHIDKCDRLFTANDVITKQIHKRFPQTKHYCQTQFHGVDVNLFRPIAPSERTNDTYIVYVGAAHADEAFATLVDAFSRLARLYVHAKFEILVRLPCTEQQFVRMKEGVSAEIRDRFNFVNGISSQDLAAHLQNATVVVSNSRQTAFNIPLAEAGACGIPCVAVQSHGSNIILEDKRSGFLVQAGDPVALATRISDLLLHANFRRQMGAAARKRVTQLFAWKKISRSVLHSYRAMLQVEQHNALTVQSSDDEAGNHNIEVAQ